MLGFPLVYFKGMRLMMFQLSGYYYKLRSWLGPAWSRRAASSPAALARPGAKKGAFEGLGFRV